MLEDETALLLRRSDTLRRQTENTAIWTTLSGDIDASDLSVELFGQFDSAWSSSAASQTFAMLDSVSHKWGAELQPVQRRLARNRRAILAPRFELARQHRHHRIVTQFVVIVQILIAKRDPEHPLADQGRDLVLDQFRTPHVVKARCEPIHHLDRSIRRAQKQRSGIRGDRAGVERRYHLASFDRFKSKEIRGTLCWHRGAPRIGDKSLQHNNFR